MHPTEIYDALDNFILYLLLAWLFRHKKFDGQVFATYLIGYAVTRTIMECFRGDYPPDHIHYGLTPGELVSIPIFIAGLAARSPALAPGSETRIEDGGLKMADNDLPSLAMRRSEAKTVASFCSPARPPSANPKSRCNSPNMLGGEIVSADSMQVYRGLDIGTAKPSPAERARVPHHLIDICDLTESFDAAQFARLAQKAVEEIQVARPGAGFLRRHGTLLQSLPERTRRSAFRRSRSSRRYWKPCPLRSCCANCANATWRLMKKLTNKIHVASSAPWK